MLITMEPEPKSEPESGGPPLDEDALLALPLRFWFDGNPSLALPMVAAPTPVAVSILFRAFMNDEGLRLLAEYLDALPSGTRQEVVNILSAARVSGRPEVAAPDLQRAADPDLQRAAEPAFTIWEAYGTVPLPAVEI